MATTHRFKGIEQQVKPDYEGLIDSVILRKKAPDRVYNMELFLDAEIQDAVAEMYGLMEGVSRDDPDYGMRRDIAVSRFLGYDSVGCRVDGVDLPTNRTVADDTADEATKKKQRSWMDEHRGPITSWEEFEQYPWPDTKNFSLGSAERQLKYLPDDMCLAGRGINFCESVTWLFGYETLCYKLFDDRDLVKAVYDKIVEIRIAQTEQFLSIDRMKYMFASDDMGFKTGPMIAPDDLIEYSLKGHKILSKMCHDKGIPYVLHCCGKRDSFMDYLMDEVKVDAIHSFEDTIEPVTEAKRRWGDRVGLIGGIDVDFLCRHTEDEVRQRVRETLEVCNSTAGYALGTGNSVANYIPVENYLAMLDEGRLAGVA